MRKEFMTSYRGQALTIKNGFNLNFDPFVGFAVCLNAQNRYLVNVRIVPAIAWISSFKVAACGDD